MITTGKRIRLAYELTVEGKPFKIIHAGKPVAYVQGAKTAEFPRALTKQLVGMKLGERKSVVLNAKDGYGAVNPSLVMTMPRSRFSHKYHFIGRQVVSERDGKHLAFVKDVKKETLLLDFNHPLAGKNLRFDVLIVGIEGEGMMSQQARNKL